MTSGRGRWRHVAAGGALLGLSLVLLIRGVLADEVLLVAVGALGAFAVEITLHRFLTDRLGSMRPVLRGEVSVRLLVVQLLVLVHVLLSDGLPVRSQLALLACVVVHQGLAAVHRGLQLVDDRLRVRRASVRNLSSSAGPLPDLPVLLAEPGSLVVAGAGALMPLALLVTAAQGSYAPVLVSAAGMVACAAVVVAASLRSLVPVLRRPRGDRLVRTAHEAVQEYAPSVIVYLSEGPQDLHCLKGWLSTLEALDRRVLLLLREQATLDALPATPLPAVCLPWSKDVRSFSLPSARVAMFVTHSQGNSDLVRNPDLFSVHIGHGDSDKAANRNPVNKLYDELWVAGPAARRRKLAGLRRPVPIRIVGRPQVRGVRPARPLRPEEPVRVLYAPTWEGLYGDPFESSLVHSGAALVQLLLGMPDVQVVYRPHPKSGFQDKAFRAADEGIVALLAEAGPQHRVVRAGDMDVYTCFNEVDILIADISGVVTDFLASDKPCFVVNGRGLPEDEFRDRNPTAAGAYLVGPGGAGLAAGLADARGPDSLRAKRRHVRADLLGPPDVDPLRLFEQALDAVSGAEDSRVGRVPVQ